MWQKLFAEIRTKTLSGSVAKGLIGELSILKEKLIPQYGIEKAIAGWVGPIGADRDFEFEDTWYEVKFVSLSADNVTISSLDQLDIDTPGELVLCRAEKTSKELVDHITLNKLVKSISEMLDDNENSLVVFKNRLALVGYNPNNEQENIPYKIHKLDAYNVVGSEFPRIRRGDLHSGVVNGSYSLSISALQQWSIE